MTPERAQLTREWVERALSSADECASLLEEIGQAVIAAERSGDHFTATVLAAFKFEIARQFDRSRRQDADS